MLRGTLLVGLEEAWIALSCRGEVQPCGRGQLILHLSRARRNQGLMRHPPQPRGGSARYAHSGAAQLRCVKGYHAETRCLCTLVGKAARAACCTTTGTARAGVVPLDTGIMSGWAERVQGDRRHEQCSTISANVDAPRTS
ncbi:hypothetical protein NDU88_006636 [Pleurodeles waltl]|uniref:Uncharacterized protein n=1 Tax=Pleurodeles waltl TaxID=8319 RepID=A0AAV7VR63_PLEWA|nr:hypothetical protein NDU88_006636 [Pleurodeles waltl]